MNTLQNFGIKMLTASVMTVLGGSVMAADIHSALSDSKAWADLNLRYEAVDQDNALEDASALTLRTRLGFSSGLMVSHLPLRLKTVVLYLGKMSLLWGLLALT